MSQGRRYKSITGPLRCYLWSSRARPYTTAVGSWHKRRKLTDADFSSLMDVPDGFGYYALAISSPTPRWILVPASKLVDRRYSIPNVLLEALRDVAYSDAWSSEYVSLLNTSCHQIKGASFDRLKALVFGGGTLALSNSSVGRIRASEPLGAAPPQVAARAVKQEPET